MERYSKFSTKANSRDTNVTMDGSMQMYVFENVSEWQRFVSFIRFDRFEILRIYVEAHYHGDVTRKHSTEREKKRERERTRQIRYTGIAAATRASRGVRPFIGGCPAPSRPEPPPRLNTPARFSLSRSFALLSVQLGLLPRCSTLSDPEYLLTRDVLDTFNDIHAQAFRSVPRLCGCR